MKKFLFTAIALVMTTQTTIAQQFSLGAPVSDFTVHDMSGRSLSYQALKGNVIVVMFFSTRCPLSNAFNFRRNTIYKDFKDRAKFIVVDSNSNESLEEVQTYAHDVGFDFPVFVDVNNAASDRFGVLATTDSFVIDSSGVMRYHGYVEDAPNPARTTNQGLRLAIEAVLAGRPVAMAETKARGCAIRHAKP